MKWKVQYPDGATSYYSPTENQLFMFDCTFKNHRNVAKKIFEGGSKVACAWVLCEHIEIHPGLKHEDESHRVRYNPRVQPNWLYEGRIMDNTSVAQLHTIDYGVYITQKI